jgi:putative Mg2+ transporter-C (MgtC) family protein
MIEWTEAALRLTAAAVIGAAIGLNRDLHHKPTGVRTLGLVAVGSALAVLAVADLDDAPDSSSRVIQGVVTSLGFLGAGVIMREANAAKVHGLTTASAVWLTSCIGCACGLGIWRPVIVACALVAILLGFGGRFERWAHGKLDGDRDDGGAEDR